VAVASYWLGKDLRRRWRTWLVLAAVVGVAVATVLALVAGARRTDSALGRLHRAYAAYAPDGIAIGGSIAGTARLDVERIAAVPGLAWVSHSVGAFVSVVDTGSGARSLDEDYLSLEVVDASHPDRPDGRLVRGRQADPDDPHEAVVHFTVAEKLDVDLGDTFTLYVANEDQAQALLQGTLPPSALVGTPVDVTIVGIDAVADEFPPRARGDGSGRVRLTPAVLPLLPDDIAAIDQVFFKLSDGVSPERVQADLISAGVDPSQLYGGPGVESRLRGTTRAIHVQAAGLLLLAGVLACCLLIIVGQALNRLSASMDADLAPLRALGVAPIDLILISVARTALIAAVGAAIGAGAAVAASGLFPVGLARIAEIHPGLDVNVAVVALGSLAAVALLTAFNVPAAIAAIRRVTARTDRAPRATVLSRAMARIGLPAPGVQGVRLALERGRGRHAVPVGTTLCGTAVAAATVAGLLTYGAGQRHLQETPRQYGWNWDLVVGDGFSSLPPGQLELAASHPGVTSYATGTMREAAVHDRPVSLYALTPLHGELEPTVLDGRAPRYDDEVLVAADTLAEAGTRLGGTIEVAVPSGGRDEYRVVGVGVLPEYNGMASAHLGEGVVMTMAGYERLLPGAVPDVLWVNVADSREGADAVATFQEGGASLAAKPAEITDFGRVAWLPGVLTVLVALLAGALFVHLLVETIRQRRQELALLKALGLRPREVRAAVAWQARTTVAVAVGPGVLVGVLAGRWLWTRYAHSLGVAPEPVIPWLWVGVIVFGAFVVAQAVATPLGHAAGRVRAAVALRTD
jgi:hypothetical protein